MCVGGITSPHTYKNPIQKRGTKIVRMGQKKTLQTVVRVLEMQNLNGVEVCNLCLVRVLEMQNLNGAKYVIYAMK